MQTISSGLIACAGSGDYQLPPAGNHMARCFRLVDVGTQQYEYNGTQKEARRLYISWELCHELDVDGKPFIISQRYTRSLHEKAALRRDLDSWRGRPFTQDELQSFNLVSIIDKPCMLNVIHKTSTKGKDFADVASVAAFPKGMDAPALRNAIELLDLAEFDPQVFNSLPKWLQDSVRESLEWQHVIGPKVSAGEIVAASTQDIPF